MAMTERNPLLQSDGEMGHSTIALRSNETARSRQNRRRRGYEHLAGGRFSNQL